MDQWVKGKCYLFINHNKNLKCHSLQQRNNLYKKILRWKCAEISHFQVLQRSADLAKISQTLYHFQQAVSSCGFANYQPKRCRECLSEHTTNNNLCWESSSPLVKTTFVFVWRCLCSPLSPSPFWWVQQQNYENSTSRLRDLFLMPISQCFLWIFITFCESNEWVSHLLIFWKGESWVRGVCK